MFSQFVNSQRSISLFGLPTDVNHCAIWSTSARGPCIFPRIVPVLLFFTQPQIPNCRHISLTYFGKYTPCTFPKTSNSTDTKGSRQRGSSAAILFELQRNFASMLARGSVPPRRFLNVRQNRVKVHKNSVPITSIGHLSRVEIIRLVSAPQRCFAFRHNSPRWLILARRSRRRAAPNRSSPTTLTLVRLIDGRSTVWATPETQAELFQRDAEGDLSYVDFTRNFDECREDHFCKYQPKTV